MSTAEILEALGHSAGIVIVVILFLKHITQQRNSRLEVEHEMVKSLKSIGETFREDSKSRQEEMIKCLDKTTNTINENSRVLGETTLVLGQTTDVLRKMNG